MARFPVQGTATAQAGNVVRVLPRATITVTGPGNTPKVYRSETGGTSFPNPFNAGESGEYQFWLEAGDTYEVTFDLGGVGASFFVKEDDAGAVTVPDDDVYATLFDAAAAVVPGSINEITVIRSAADTPRAPATYRRTTPEEWDTFPDRLRFVTDNGGLFVIGESVVATAMAGAVCDGVTLDHDAVEAAFAFFNLGDVGYDIKFSRGQNLTNGLHTPTKSGRILADKGGVLKGALNHNHLIYRPISEPIIDFLSIEGLGFEGDWGGMDHTDVALMQDRNDRAGGGATGQLMFVQNIKVLRMNDCEGKWGTRQGFTGRNVEESYFTRCRVSQTCRSGLNVVNGRVATAIDCHFADLDDDFINFSRSDYGLVSGCTAINCADLKATSVQKFVAVGNTLNFMKSDGIAVGSGSALEGLKNVHHLVIANNTITNVFRRTYIDGLNNNSNYIRVSQRGARAGTELAIPGMNDPATSTVVPVYPYMLSDLIEQPLPAGYAVLITGNTIGRTVGIGKTYNEVMGRRFFTKNGYLDDQLVGPNDFQTGNNHGISVGNLSDTIISGNVILGVTSGVRVTASADVNVRNVLVTDNVISDFAGDGVYTTLTTTPVDDDDTGTEIPGGNIDVTISNNQIDGDPFHVRPNRNLNGTWSDITVCNAFKFEAKGALIETNKIRNVSGVVRGLGVDGILAIGNVLFCKPTGIGSNGTNQGVRGVPVPGDGWRYVIEDSDPSSATFQQVLNPCNLDAPAMPTTGYWLTGQVVKNTAIANPNDATQVRGWQRLTVGSANVLGVDWAEIKTVGQERSVEFATRAEAAASSSRGASLLSIGSLNYTYNADGTALTTADGRNWSPLPPFHADHWGVTRFINDGTKPAGDNTPKLQAAHDYIAALGGGELDLGFGTIPFGTTLYLGEGPSVMFKGHGRGMVVNGKVGLKASSATRLVWTGTSGVNGIVLTSDRNNTGTMPRRSGGGIVDVMLDGAESGGTGLSVISHNDHTIRVMLCYWTTRMFHSTCLSNGLFSGPADNQMFLWNIHTADVNTTSEPTGGHVVINGQGIANTSLGVIEELRVSAESAAIGVHIGYSDAINIQTLTSGVRGTPVGDGGKVFFHAGDTLPVAAGIANGHARHHTIQHCQATRGIVAKAIVATGNPSGPNRVNDLTRGNGAPLPTIETGALLSYGTAENGEFVPAITFPGSSPLNLYKAPTPFTMEIADAATGGNVSANGVSASWTQIGGLIMVEFRAVNIDTTGMTAGNQVYFRWAVGPPLPGTVSVGSGGVIAADVAFSGYLTPAPVLASQAIRLMDVRTAVAQYFLKVSDLTTGAADINVSCIYSAG